MEAEAFISSLPRPRKLLPGEMQVGLISSYEAKNRLVIYVQPVEYDDQIRSIGSTLESLPPRDFANDMSFLNNAQAGVRVLAKYSADEAWYRAIILELQDERTDDEQVTVFFMDWGNTEKIKLKDIRVIGRGHEFHKLPAYAFKCMVILEPGQNAEEMDRFLSDATADSRDINFEVLGEAPKSPNCYNIRIQDITIPSILKVEIEDTVVPLSGAEAIRAEALYKSCTQRAESKPAVDSAPGISDRNVAEIDKPEDEQPKVTTEETQFNLKQLVQDVDCPSMDNMGVKGLLPTAVATSEKVDSSLTCNVGDAEPTKLIPEAGIDKAIKEATFKMVETEPFVDFWFGEASEPNAGSGEPTDNSCTQMAANETVVDSAPRFAVKDVGIDKTEDEKVKVTTDETQFNLTGPVQNDSPSLDNKFAQDVQIAVVTSGRVGSSLIFNVGNAEAEPNKFIPEEGFARTIKEIGIPIIKMVDIDVEPIVDMAGEASEQNVGSGEQTDESCSQMAENEIVVGSEPRVTEQNVGIKKPKDYQACVTADETHFNLMGQVQDLGLGDTLEPAASILENVDSSFSFYGGDAEPTEFTPEQRMGKGDAFIKWVERQPAVDSVQEDAGYYRGMMRSFETVHTLTGLIKEIHAKVKDLEKSNHELMVANNYYRIELARFQGKPVPKPIRGPRKEY